MTAAIKLVDLKLSNIKISPLNPRKRFDDASFNNLVDSVVMEGVLQPITVRETIDSVRDAINRGDFGDTHRDHDQYEPFLHLA